MAQPKSLADWIRERGLDEIELAECASLDVKIVVAIVAGRYTTSPRQREKIAGALQLGESDIRWSGAVEVDHMYGHGPQFGRSP